MNIFARIWARLAMASQPDETVRLNQERRDPLTTRELLAFLPPKTQVRKVLDLRGKCYMKQEVLYVSPTKLCFRRQDGCLSCASLVGVRVYQMRDVFEMRDIQGRVLARYVKH